MTLPGLLRAKVVLARHGRTVAAVLCVVGILSLGGVGWWATHPPTTTVTDHTQERTVATDVETSALVTSDSTLYDRGDRLTNQEVYFRDTTPNLTVRLRTDVTPDEGPVVVEQRMALVTRVTRDGDVFWERTRPLADDRAEVTDGNATTAAALSVARLERQSQAVREEVGPAGEVALFVRVVVTYETERYEGTTTRLVPIRVGSHSYALSPTTLSATESTPVDQQVPVPNRDTLPGMAMGGLGLLALAGAVTGVVAERRFDAAAAEARLHRQRFEEWISTGRVGPGLGEEYVHMTSLGELVDVGIDTDKRVIHDPETDVYAVIDDRVVYHYGQAAGWHQDSAPSTGGGEPATDSPSGRTETSGSVSQGRPATDGSRASQQGREAGVAGDSDAEEAARGSPAEPSETTADLLGDAGADDADGDAGDPGGEFEWPLADN